MSEIKHTTLKGELLYLIGRASSPLSSAELYERSELADEIVKVSKALANLQNDGKIVRVEGPGRARYKLADGVAAPAPAGKAGRSKAEQKDDTGAPAKPDDAAGLLTVGYGKPLTGIRPAPEAGPPALDIPGLGDHLAGLGGAAGQTVRREPEVDDEAVAKGLDQVERQLEAGHLADAIIARLKRQLAPTLAEMEAAIGLDRLNVHIHIEQVDIHLGGL